MAIKFFNVNSGEERVATTEPMITAFWASSDRSPNVREGQDFGWRLDPEVAAQLDEIRRDVIVLEKIATKHRVSIEDVSEGHIIKYISSTSDTTSELKNRLNELKKKLQNRLVNRRVKVSSGHI
jgi:hypothetical protein